MFYSVDMISLLRLNFTVLFSPYLLHINKIVCTDKADDLRLWLQGHPKVFWELAAGHVTDISKDQGQDTWSPQWLSKVYTWRKQSRISLFIYYTMTLVSFMSRSLFKILNFHWLSLDLKNRLTTSMADIYSKVSWLQGMNSH